MHPYKHTGYITKSMFRSCVVAVSLLLAQGASAESTDKETSAYPDRPVRIIVPVSAGGSTDTLARIVAQKLGEKWKQSVIVENVTGAGGAIGAAQVARAKPDGYTLVIHSDAIVLNTILLKKAPYRLDDLTGVGRIAVNPQILVSSPNFEAATFRQYIDYAKKNPDTLSLGLPTSGGIAHIAHEVLAREAGISVNYIPYKGGAPAALDTMAGHINATVITLAAVTEYIKDGRLRPLAVTTAYRSPQFPNVPTMAESGYPGVDVESWQGMLAPKGTPDAIVKKINDAIQTVMADQDVRQQIEKQGFGIGVSSSEDFNLMLKKVHKSYGDVIAQAGIVQQ